MLFKIKSNNSEVCKNVNNLSLLSLVQILKVQPIFLSIFFSASICTVHVYIQRVLQNHLQQTGS